MRDKIAFAGMGHDKEAKKFTLDYLETIATKVEPARGTSEWGLCPLCKKGSVLLKDYIDIDGKNAFNIMTRSQTAPKLVCEFCGKVFLWVQMQRTTLNKYGGELVTHWVEVYAYDPKKELFTPLGSFPENFVLS